ncbi:MAG TPA: PIG-L family deacetylase [Chloroflexaceae bacterium]|nr:PIG-L family deacetylase [Chloroflexaceae bacterium]
MDRQPRLTCVLAHPDDAAMALGGLLAKYAAEGVATSLVIATRGAEEWFDDPADYPGREQLGRVREAELRAAAADLGVGELAVLDYHEGELGLADPPEIIGRVAGQLRRLRPDVVITMDPLGFYGDPDHVAICQYATAAAIAAADGAYATDPPGAPHRTARLYYLAPDEAVLATWRAHFGRMRKLVDGVERAPLGWPAWAISARIDSAAYWRQAWGAVCRHGSQLPQRERLEGLPAETHQRLWCAHTLYRVSSFAGGGLATEDDLFGGLREGGSAG